MTEVNSTSKNGKQRKCFPNTESPSSGHLWLRQILSMQILHGRNVYQEVKWAEANWGFCGSRQSAFIWKTHLLSHFVLWMYHAVFVLDEFYQNKRGRWRSWKVQRVVGFFCISFCHLLTLWLGGRSATVGVTLATKNMKWRKNNRKVFEKRSDSVVLLFWSAQRLQEQLGWFNFVFSKVL